MKLSAQLVSILPCPKVRPPGSAGKDVFATSMQSVMATFSGKPTASLKQFPLAEPSPKPVLTGPTTATPATFSLNAKMSEGKQHCVPEVVANPATNAETSNRTAVITEGEAREQLANSRVSLQNSMLLGGISEQSAAQESVLTNPPKGGVILRQPATKSSDGLDTPIIYATSHPQQKGHSIKGHQAEPAIRPGIQPGLSTVIQALLPVAIQQTGGRGNEISAGQAQVESRNDELRFSGPPFVAPASSANTDVGNGLQVRMQRKTQPGAATVPANTHFVSLAGSNLDAGMASRANQNLLEQAVYGSGDHNVPALQTDVHVTKDGARETVTEMRSDATSHPNQNLLSMRATHGKEDHDVSASQVDSHSLSEVEKAIVTTAAVKAVATENPPVDHAVSPPVQHESELTIPLPSRTLHLMEAAVETHRTQINAAQVLQKMDMALPSSAVQLRADARHLDIGVTSSSLGWVEIRATASPSGRVDAALHVESSVSAHVLTAEPQKIAEYAREHSVQLGQISVGVGTGDGTRGDARSTEQPAHSEETAPAERAVREPVSGDMRLTDRVSLISVRA